MGKWDNILKASFFWLLLGTEMNGFLYINFLYCSFTEFIDESQKLRPDAGSSLGQNKGNLKLPWTAKGSVGWEHLAEVCKGNQNIQRGKG